LTFVVQPTWKIIRTVRFDLAARREKAIVYSQEYILTAIIERPSGRHIIAIAGGRIIFAWSRSPIKKPIF